MSTNRSGRARSMSMEGAMSHIGIIGSPPQTIPEVEEGRLGIPDMGVRVVDERDANSALTSRTTVAMQDDRKKDVYRRIEINILVSLADDNSSCTCKMLDNTSFPHSIIQAITGI